MLSQVIRRYIGTQDSKFLKKFYKKATVEEITSIDNNPKLSGSQGSLNEFKIQLDGRNIKTPDGHVVSMKSKALAQIIANEFNMQEKYLKSATMPVLGMVRTCIDYNHREAFMREPMVNSLLGFLQSDTVRYRDENQALKKKQYQEFTPIIEYINTNLNINMKATEELFAPSTLQNEQDIDRIQNEFRKLSNWRLISLESACSNMKSTSLAIALVNEIIDVEKAAELSYLEERFQIEEHGLVEGNHDFDYNTTILNVSVAKMVYDLSE